MRSLLIVSTLFGTAALSDSEIAKFGSRACPVVRGTCRGETLSGSVSVSASAGEISIRTNSVPDHATCADDGDPGQTCYNAPLTAYIQPQDIALTIPRTPEVSDAKTALPAGPIAYATNGVAIFSAYSAPCSDALTDEAIGFDACQGHPEPNRGVYHYHAASSCLDGYMEAVEKKEPFFIGVAADGFPIYSKYDSSNTEITNAQLDECHGYDPGDGYRYIANDEFPYVIGCFRGTPTTPVSAHCSRRLNLAELSRLDAALSASLAAITDVAEESNTRRLQRVPPGGGGGGGGGGQTGCSTPLADPPDDPTSAGLPMCAAIDNSACAGGACGFPCVTGRCALWPAGTSGDDITGGGGADEDTRPPDSGDVDDGRPPVDESDGDDGSDGSNGSNGASDGTARPDDGANGANGKEDDNGGESSSDEPYELGPVKLSTSGLIGASVGVGIGALLLICLLYCICCRRKGADGAAAKAAANARSKAAANGEARVVVLGSPMPTGVEQRGDTVLPAAAEKRHVDVDYQAAGAHYNSDPVVPIHTPRGGRVLPAV